MIVKEQFVGLFSWLKINNEVATKDLFAQVLASQAGYSVDIANEWIEGIIDGLFFYGVLEEKSFESFKNKALVLDNANDLLINNIVSNLNNYLEKNLLSFQKKQRLLAIDEELKFWGEQPDVIDNLDKKVNIQSLLDEKEDLLR